MVLLIVESHVIRRSLFQSTGPDVERIFDQRFRFDGGYTDNATVTGRTELSRWCINLQERSVFSRAENNAI